MFFKIAQMALKMEDFPIKECEISSKGRLWYEAELRKWLVENDLRYSDGEVSKIESDFTFVENMLDQNPGYPLYGFSSQEELDDFIREQTAIAFPWKYKKGEQE